MRFVPIKSAEAQSVLMLHRARSGFSKMGDRYLRYLLVVGAIAVVRYTHRKTTAISIWANRLLERKAARLVTVVVANKMARIAWAVMARNENYRATSVAA
jgi:transposase